MWNSNKIKESFKDSLHENRLKAAKKLGLQFGQCSHKVNLLLLDAYLSYTTVTVGRIQ